MLKWILGKTKFGKAVQGAQGFLERKKTYLVGVATMVPALVNLILRFQQDGIGAFKDIADDRNFELLMVGLGMITGRAAIAKVEKKTGTPTPE